MKTSETPDYDRWLGLAAKETLTRGYYDEFFNSRLHCKISEDGSIIEYGYFGEEPRSRKVIDTDGQTHSITYFGYIEIYNRETKELVNVSFLEDGRTWLHIDYSGQEQPSDRRFVSIGEATLRLEVVPEHIQ